MAVCFSVECDAIEISRHKTEPCAGLDIYVSDDGKTDLYGAWLNIPLGGCFREIVKRSGKDIPFIMKNVIYDGITYSIIKVEDLPTLKQELDCFATIHADNNDDEKLLSEFKVELMRIVEIAIRLSTQITRG